MSAFWEFLRRQAAHLDETDIEAVIVFNAALMQRYEHQFEQVQQLALSLPLNSFSRIFWRVFLDHPDCETYRTSILLHYEQMFLAGLFEQRKLQSVTGLWLLYRLWRENVPLEEAKALVFDFLRREFELPRGA